ncbi:MFS transporter [Pseudarthrobacter sp. W1I19]|uniref:MFS transporter n=1 Tax=Pseudarthrobacter sp. W1I19 TaxID=3042288 RepID=UPI0027D7AA0E|nr:MFS transporter [Pseudarthrobacter sp. W1I19]
MSPKTAFAILAVATVALMATASAPSPIYPIYQERWHFSTTLLTVIFTVYVAGLLGALLTVGSLSDHIGRRPVLVAAFLVAATSTALFWTANGPAALITARLAQGVASGTAMSALAAGLLDFAPRARPHLGATLTAVGTSLGMATGAGAVGLLSQWTPRPDFYVFPVLTLMFLGLAAVSCLLPQARVRRVPAWAAVRPRLRLETHARPQFWASVPSTIAGWAATGLFLALVPSLVREELHLKFASAGGLTIAVLYIAVTVGGIWSTHRSARGAVILGAALMTGGAATLALSLEMDSIQEFAAGSFAVGLGIGLTFNGNLRSIGNVTAPARRSQTFTIIYILSYASLSIPTLAAGIVAPSWGLEVTSHAFIGFVGTLSAGALACAVLFPLTRKSNSPT